MTKQELITATATPEKIGPTPQHTQRDHLQTFSHTEVNYFCPRRT